MKDIIVERSLQSARLQANRKYPDLALLNWYDGKITAVSQLYQKDIVAQGAKNEARFLISYARRHGAKS